MDDQSKLAILPKAAPYCSTTIREKWAPSKDGLEKHLPWKTINIMQKNGAAQSERQQHHTSNYACLKSTSSQRMSAGEGNRNAGAKRAEWVVLPKVKQQMLSDCHASFDSWINIAKHQWTNSCCAISARNWCTERKKVANKYKQHYEIMKLNKTVKCLVLKSLRACLQLTGDRDPKHW